jgi:hypothetical protein
MSTIEIWKTSAGTTARQRTPDPEVANRRLSQSKGAEGRWPRNTPVKRTTRR